MTEKEKAKPSEALAKHFARKGEEAVAELLATTYSSGAAASSVGAVVPAAGRAAPGREAGLGEMIQRAGGTGSGSVRLSSSSA